MLYLAAKQKVVKLGNPVSFLARAMEVGAGSMVGVLVENLRMVDTQKLIR